MILQNGLHGIFVHTQCGSTHITAHIGHSQGLQIALQRPIFYIGAVNDGESHIDFMQQVIAEFLHRITIKLYSVSFPDPYHLGQGF